MTEYVCPKCKRADRLAEVNVMLGYALGAFNRDGVFIFEGYTEVDWDSQAVVKEGNRYICLACSETFNTPDEKREEQP